jgi:tripartite-type tricarboxylate transporter receptor subunit TctC
MINCKLVGGALLALLFATLASVVRADHYPSKTIRIVVPFPAGSSSDVQTRARSRSCCPAK